MSPLVDSKKNPEPQAQILEGEKKKISEDISYFLLNKDKKDPV